MSLTSNRQSGHFLTNLLHFGRLLRAVGFRISSQQINELSQALSLIDLSSQEDFYYCSRAFLLKDHNSQDIFDLAFELFWTRNTAGYIEYVIAPRRRDSNSQNGVLNDSIGTKNRLTYLSNPIEKENEELESHKKWFNPIYSPDELLISKDFSQMNSEEFERVRDYLRRTGWIFGSRISRRKVPTMKKTGDLSLRKMLRSGIRYDGEIIRLSWRKKKVKPRPVVILCDISGSMERYSTFFLYFLYGLIQGAGRVEAFVFATRLTRVTDQLKHGDLQTTLESLSKQIFDWAGGTRIGESLRVFNQVWSRRVLRYSPLVLILSDGWDRGDLKLLEKEIDRLSRSVHRLIWLNPLAGSPDYQPLVGGIRTIMPYVDHFLPFNNLESVDRLVVKLLTLSYA